MDTTNQISQVRVVREVSETSSSMAILTLSSLENSVWPDAKQFYSMTP